MDRQREEPVPASDCGAARSPLPRGPCIRPAQVVASTLGGCPRQPQAGSPTTAPESSAPG